MCRFLLLKSKCEINPEPIIKNFSEIARKSKSLDGDWQGDGWGVCWLDNNSWSIYKSLLPIWKDTASFARIPETKSLVIHARSSSFSQDKNNILYNQPYGDNDYTFVFNGLLNGVRIPLKTEGEIGAQKIWFLLKKFMQNDNPEKAILKLINLLIKYTNKIQALNIGLSDKKKLYAYSLFDSHPEYYQLKYHQTEDLVIVSSEAIKGYKFNSLTKGLSKTFDILEKVENPDFLFLKK